MKPGVQSPGAVNGGVKPRVGTTPYRARATGYITQCTRYTFGSFDSRVNAPFTPVLNRERKGEGERKRENKS